jgi:hypothetical protein
MQLREKEVQATANPFTSSNSRWSQSELDRLQSFCKSDLFSNSKVEVLRSEACASAEAPDTETKLVLSQFQVSKPTVVSYHPWVSQVCKQREHFTLDAFIISEPGPNPCCYYMFGFAQQNPMVLGLISLVRKDVVPDVQHDANLAEQFGKRLVYDFAIQPLHCRYSHKAMNAIKIDMARVVEDLVLLEEILR